jgi:hypothetical protein
MCGLCAIQLALEGMSEGILGREPTVWIASADVGFEEDSLQLHYEVIYLHPGLRGILSAMVSSNIQVQTGGLQFQCSHGIMISLKGRLSSQSFHLYIKTVIISRKRFLNGLSHVKNPLIVRRARCDLLSLLNGIRRRDPCCSLRSCEIRHVFHPL